MVAFRVDLPQIPPWNIEELRVEQNLPDRLYAVWRFLFARQGGHCEFN